MLPDVALAMALSAHGIERSSSSLRERQLQDSNAVRSGVTGCRDDASRATDGLPSASDAPLQHSELAKSAISLPRPRRISGVAEAASQRIG